MRQAALLTSPRVVVGLESPLGSFAVLATACNPLPTPGTSPWTRRIAVTWPHSTHRNFEKVIVHRIWPPGAPAAGTVVDAAQLGGLTVSAEPPVWVTEMV